jgi:hypothetical protein
MGLDSPDHTKSGPSGSGFFYTTSFVIATENKNLARRANHRHERMRQMARTAISAAQRPQRGRRGPENSTDLPVGQWLSEAWALAHCPLSINAILPETRPSTLIGSTDINVRYPAYHGLNADSVQCCRCAKS